jgi:hypothetical protein
MRCKSKKIEEENSFMEFQKEKKSCVNNIFELIKGCKRPLIASGATPIGSASRAPDEIEKEEDREATTVFLILENIQL